MPPEHPTLDALADAPERALDLPRDVAALLLARVGAIEAVLRARLAGPPGGNGEDSTGDDTMLSAAQAAKRTGMSRRWLYAQAAAGALPFARRVSAHGVRFSGRGIDRWLARRKAGLQVP